MRLDHFKRGMKMLEQASAHRIQSLSSENLSGDYGSRLAARLDAIRNAPLPPDDELPPLSVRQLERIKAFALREDRSW